MTARSKSNRSQGRSRPVPPTISMIVDIDLCLLDLLQQQLGVPVQHKTGLGRRDAGIAARQKLVLEMTLECRDLLRQRGLRSTQNAGGARYATGIDDLHEALQLCEINAHGSAASPCQPQTLGRSRQEKGPSGHRQVAAAQRRSAQAFSMRSHASLIVSMDVAVERRK